MTTTQEATYGPATLALLDKLDAIEQRLDVIEDLCRQILATYDARDEAVARNAEVSA